MRPIHSSAVSDKVLVQTIVAAISEVHATLGPGFTETVYEEALATEFSLRKIHHQRQADISIIYKGNLIGRHSAAFLVEGRVLVELQTADLPLSTYKSRLLAYLRAAGKRVSLLVDFNASDIKKGVKLAYIGGKSAPADAEREAADAEDDELTDEES